MAGMSRLVFLCALLQGFQSSTATPIVNKRAGTALSNVDYSLTLIFQNNLNTSDDYNHVGAILLDAMPQSAALAACQSLSEILITPASIAAHEADFYASLSYLTHTGLYPENQAYLTSNGTVALALPSGLQYPAIASVHDRFPVLCTQSSTGDKPSAPASASNEVSIASGGNTYIGFRNLKSFRFQGIPFGDNPARFEYSSVYSQTGQTIQATAYGPECAQPYNPGSAEDCLFLNIQTPYLPEAGRTRNLRPVMFWIHGGGFTSGNGADTGSDGGNLASREDIVVVSINYRLTTLGFLAIPGTDILGNFGIGDQVTALKAQWVIANIASFGGDPTKITIIGESAGAGSVRTLLGSPPAIGKFQGAVAMSNLGGGVDLGIGGDYATTYSSYLTVAQSYSRVGQQIFQAAGCTQATLDAQIACLKTVPAQTIVNLGTVARYVVQDGTYVNTEELILTNHNGSTARVPVIFGNTANDGASFSTYPTTPVTSEVQGIEASLGISQAYAQSIIDSGLFPYYDTGNITLDSFNVSQRVATDIQFRCIDQATVYAGMKSRVFPRTYYYQMDRTGAGYDPNNLGGPPLEPGYPYGDPELPYFRLHGSDMPWVFGNLYPLRDANDLYSIQLISGYFAEFVKSGRPNPDVNYLIARGYTKTLQSIQANGPWNEVSSATGPIELLDYPSVSAPFVDLPQCAFLNYSITYYIDGGK